jgi:hypothetical protein
MTRRRWYVDVWRRTDRAAYRAEEVSSLEAVRRCIEARGADEIVRIIPPIDASRADLDALLQLGARPS